MTSSVDNGVVVPRDELEALSRVDASITSAIEARGWAILKLSAAPAPVEHQAVFDAAGNCLCPHHAPVEQEAYQRGWNDREADLLCGEARVTGREQEAVAWRFRCGHSDWVYNDIKPRWEPEGREEVQPLYAHPAPSLSREEEDAIILAMCRAHDAEESAAIGDPSPWREDFDRDPDWEQGRFLAMREAFDVARARLEGAK